MQPARSRIKTAANGRPLWWQTVLAVLGKEVGEVGIPVSHVVSSHCPVSHDVAELRASQIYLPLRPRAQHSRALGTTSPNPSIFPIPVATIAEAELLCYRFYVLGQF